MTKDLQVTWNLCCFMIHTSLNYLADVYPTFELDEMEDDECLAEFRAQKRDTPLLADVTWHVEENMELIQDKEKKSMLEQAILFVKKYKL